MIELLLMLRITVTELLNVDASVEKAATGELQVGDRIIEVNGEPVQDQSLAQVRMLNFYEISQSLYITYLWFIRMFPCTVTDQSVSNAHCS